MKTKKAKNTGISAKAPSKSCDDMHCPFHGNLTLHGQVLEGTIIASKSAKTAKIEFLRLYQLPKFERYEKRRTRLQVHNPPCIDAQVGDKVKVMACRPISKTKNFVIIEIKGKEDKTKQ